MLASVEFDVAIEVVLEAGEAATAAARDLADHLAEEIGEEVFATEGESRGEFGRAVAFDQFEGLGDESLGAGGGVRPGERLPPRLALRDSRHQPMDGIGVGAELLHGAKVQLEMAGGPALGIEVGLFLEHDVVDEAGRRGMSGGDPGQGHTGEGALEGLRQRHEVPDGEDVVFHEHLDRLGTDQLAMEAMGEQPAAQRVERATQRFQLGRGQLGSERRG